MYTTVYNLILASLCVFNDYGMMPNNIIVGLVVEIEGNLLFHYFIIYYIVVGMMNDSTLCDSTLSVLIIFLSLAYHQ